MMAKIKEAILCLGLAHAHAQTTVSRCLSGPGAANIMKAS